nr:MAG TPA: hypothetical protein [Caudoviricetes sp.]
MFQQRTSIIRLARSIILVKRDMIWRLILII